MNLESEDHEREGDRDSAIAEQIGTSVRASARSSDRRESERNGDWKTDTEYEQVRWKARDRECMDI